ncbi:MAG: hypothetical protein GY782_09870 [Gammaproteobacteria bacterium]|nr:hypothetical protein [Gammaproteobacteria bacterium]
MPRDVYNEYKKDFAAIPIMKKSDKLEQLNILKDQLNLRFDNDYYSIMINDLIKVFEYSLQDGEFQPMLSRFRESLVPLIEEIYNNLQEMNIKELEHEVLLSPNPQLQEIDSYDLAKFNEWVVGNNDFPCDYFLRLVNEATDNKYRFHTDDTISERFLKAKLMFAIHN